MVALCPEYDRELARLSEPFCGDCDLAVQVKVCVPPGDRLRIVRVLECARPAQGRDSDVALRLNSGFEK